ncbi:MAG: hypothetical protein JSS07_02440 [Proteobacteria bacterium]|nr:hypothetical protein [Pseudomonadota bacterium]
MIGIDFSDSAIQKTIKKNLTRLNRRAKLENDFSMVDEYGFNLLEYALMLKDPILVATYMDKGVDSEMAEYLAQDNTALISLTKLVYETGEKPLTTVARYFLYKDKSYESDPDVQFYNNAIPDYIQNNLFERNTITQTHLIRQFTAYLKLVNQSLPETFQNGKCGGLSFLAKYYTERGKQDEFFNCLNLIMKWDGTERGLSRSVRGVEGYKNYKELLEQWLNDIIWFQQLELDPALKTLNPEQDARELQYNMLKKDDSPFLHESIDFDGIRPNLNTISEYLIECAKVGQPFHFEIGASKHKSYLFLSQKGEFTYYDPNDKEKKVTTDPLEVARLIHVAHFEKIDPAEFIFINISPSLLNQSPNLTIEENIKIAKASLKKLEEPLSEIHVKRLIGKDEKKYQEILDTVSSDTNENMLQMASSLNEPMLVKGILTIAEKHQLKVNRLEEALKVALNNNSPEIIDMLEKYKAKHQPKPQQERPKAVAFGYAHQTSQPTRPLSGSTPTSQIKETPKISIDEEKKGYKKL